MNRFTRFMKSAISPEVREVFTPPPPIGRLGYRFGTSRPQGRGRRGRVRAEAALERKLLHMRAVLPPEGIARYKGHRREEFCGQDDLFWTTADGDITSGIVKPRRHLYTPFR